VLNFIQYERLHWDSITPSSDPPFTNCADYKILVNDWPYGIDLEISHLVVWTKFVFETDAETGDLTERARAEIEEFVRGKFCGVGGVERKDLVWFRNWSSLKSVHAVGKCLTYQKVCEKPFTNVEWYRALSHHDLQGTEGVPGQGDRC
jgi:Protein of unknown function (DUF3605)